jgi:hypothetical protein
MTEAAAAAAPTGTTDAPPVERISADNYDKLDGAALATGAKELAFEIRVATVQGAAAVRAHERRRPRALQSAA